MIEACRSQLRVGGMGQPFALDYGAVMAVAAALDADAEMLAQVLAAVESAVLRGLDGDVGGED